MLRLTRHHFCVGSSAQPGVSHTCAPAPSPARPYRFAFVCWSLLVPCCCCCFSRAGRSASQHHFMGEPQSPCVKKCLCVEDHVVLQARAQFARALSLPSPRNGHALSAAPKQSLLAKPARDLHEIHPPPAPLRAYRLTSAGGRAAELVDGMLRAARLVLACFCT